MAKISFDEVSTNSGEHYEGNSVGIFSLKNDGDEAIVRIMHDSVEDFDILTTHPITVNGKYRSVNCVRDPKEPLDNCPLCKSGAKVNTRIFLHMIQYVVGEGGKIEAKPVVWERSAGVYAPTLKNYLAEYGPLSDCVFKIRRRGAKGDMSTTYDILFGNPNMYKEESYPKLKDAFNGYSVSGGLVLNKTADEINTYLETGSFPDTNNSSASNKTAPVQNSYQPSSSFEPKSNNSSVERPTRYY